MQKLCYFKIRGLISAFQFYEQYFHEKFNEFLRLLKNFTPKTVIFRGILQQSNLHPLDSTAQIYTLVLSQIGFRLKHEN